MRTWGDVRCEVKWEAVASAGARPNVQVQERRLTATFYNLKDVPVTVWNMRVEFYKEGQPLEAWTLPNLALVDERERSSPLGPVNIPPHDSRQRTISVTPGRDDTTRELQKADRAAFVARIEGVEYHRLDLTPPW